MKHLQTAILPTLCFLLLLCFPGTVFQGAKSGLLLWFHTVLPTLLPFFIAANYLIRTDAAGWISRLTAPVFCRLLNITPYGCFVLICGFLCGYPTGAKTAADLLRAGRISPSECCYLLSFCNNASPGFILNFLVLQCLKSPDLALPSLVLLLGVPLLFSAVFYHLHFPLAHRRSGTSSRSEIPADNTANKALRALSFKPDKGSAGMADLCIMDGISSITRIGGYIMLFSIFFSLLQRIPDPPLFMKFLISTVEMTTGAMYLCSLGADGAWEYAAVIFLISFGGLCCAAQTFSVIRDAGIPRFPYIAEKLATACVTSLIAYFYYVAIYI